MDWHSRQADLTIRDENGRKLKSRRVRGGLKEVLAEFDRIDRPFRACFEASTGYGVLFDELSKRADTVKAAHPGHLRLIFRSKKKSDRPEGPLLQRSGPAGVDSDKLAKLLHLGEVPEVHVPNSDVRSWRATIRTAGRSRSWRRRTTWRGSWPRCSGRAKSSGTRGSTGPVPGAPTSGGGRRRAGPEWEDLSSGKRGLIGPTSSSRHGVARGSGPQWSGPSGCKPLDLSEAGPNSIVWGAQAATSNGCLGDVPLSSAFRLDEVSLMDVCRQAGARRRAHRRAPERRRPQEKGPGEAPLSGPVPASWSSRASGTSTPMVARRGVSSSSTDGSASRRTSAAPTRPAGSGPRPRRSVRSFAGVEKIGRLLLGDAPSAWATWRRTQDEGERLRELDREERRGVFQDGELPGADLPAKEFVGGNRSRAHGVAWITGCGHSTSGDRRRTAARATVTRGSARTSRHAARERLPWA
jgi:hypothetical protein